MFFLTLLGAIPYQATSLTPQERVIILKTGEPSQIKEEHRAMCPRGDVRFRFPQLPYQLQEDSLLIQIKGKDTSLDILNKKFENLKLDFRNFLIQSFGKQVNLITPNLQGKEDTQTVVLLSIDQNNRPTVFSRGMIEFDPPGRIGFPKESVTFFPSLEVSFVNPLAQPCTCTMNYICPLFFWRTFYTAEIDVQKNTLSFQGTLKVHNLTGISFTDTSLLWMPSWDKNPTAMAQKLSDQITIPHGMYHSFSFLSRSSALSFSYHMVINPTALEGDKSLAQKRITLKDIDLRRLPDGPLHVYLKRQHDTFHSVTHPLKKFSQDHLELILDQEPTLSLHVKTIQTRALGKDKKEVTCYLELHNDSQSEHMVELSLSLPPGSSFVRAYQEPKSVQTSVLRWEMMMPAKEKRSFWYRIVSPLSAP
jgi:hypothetical protein